MVTRPGRTTYKHVGRSRSAAPTETYRRLSQSGALTKAAVCSLSGTAVHEPEGLRGAGTELGSRLIQFELVLAVLVLEGGAGPERRVSPGSGLRNRPWSDLRISLRRNRLKLGAATADTDIRPRSRFDSVNSGPTFRRSHYGRRGLRMSRALGPHSALRLNGPMGAMISRWVPSGSSK